MGVGVVQSNGGDPGANEYKLQANARGLSLRMRGASHTEMATEEDREIGAKRLEEEQGKAADLILNDFYYMVPVGRASERPFHQPYLTLSQYY